MKMDLIKLLCLVREATCDLQGDGGVVKKVIKAGSGWEQPSTGDSVSVHYVGTLEDGTKFDSSRDRDDAFTFTLGQGRPVGVLDGC